MRELWRLCACDRELCDALTAEVQPHMAEERYLFLLLSSYER